MTSLAKRVILACIGVPFLFSLIVWVPHYHHLAFAILACVVVTIGSYEMARLAFHHGYAPLLKPWTGLLLPVARYIELAFLPSVPLLHLVFTFLCIIALTKEVFLGAKDTFTTTFERTSRMILLLVYPGYLSTFFIDVLFYQESTLLLLMLFLVVFSNDTFCYLIGMLWGKTNRNIIAASPNKSIVGYIGGMVMAMAISILWVFFIPSLRVLFTFQQALIIGFCVALASDLGDLVESAFKRGAQVKDSGTIMLGRGGILDSIDSLLFGTPFFLLLITVFL